MQIQSVINAHKFKIKHLKLLVHLFNYLKLTKLWFGIKLQCNVHYLPMIKIHTNAQFNIFHFSTISTETFHL